MVLVCGSCAASADLMYSCVTYRTRASLTCLFRHACAKDSILPWTACGCKSCSTRV
jgi:hypothetical protein